jgi:hypothetical protein
MTGERDPNEFYPDDELDADYWRDEYWINQRELDEHRDELPRDEDIPPEEQLTLDTASRAAATGPAPEPPVVQDGPSRKPGGGHRPRVPVDTDDLREHNDESR